MHPASRSGLFPKAIGRLPPRAGGGALKEGNRKAPAEPLWLDPKSHRPITPHGLRATFRTWGEDVGFARDLLEEALGHQIGNSVERAYRRTESFHRRRAIME